MTSHLIDSGEGECPFMRDFLSEVSTEENIAAVLFTTVCDQMRRAPECLSGVKTPPLYLMHVPSTWKTIAAQKLYRQEVKRLGNFLVRLGGASPSGEKLHRVMCEFDEKRSILKDKKGSMDPRAYSEAIALFHRTGTVIKKSEKTADIVQGIPVAIIGGPLKLRDFSLFDVIKEAGGRVALDGTETGELTMLRPFHRQHMRADPFTEMVEAYFGHIPGVFRRPNSDLYIWMKREFQATQVKGVILIRSVWCDLWHGEVQRIREWLELPLLDIDLNGKKIPSL